MYQYTRSNKYINDNLRDFYEENGYIVLPNLVDHGLLDECKQRFIDYCNGTASNPVKVTQMKDMLLKTKDAKGEYLINKIQDFVYDDVLFKYIKYGPMVDIIESIIGPNVTACHTMLINKPPDSAKDFSEHPMHQDLHYFPFRPVNSIVASWTAMEHIDEINGCLFVVPGSHKTEKLYKHMYKQDTQNNPMYYRAEGFPDRPKVNLCMEKGDTVFFHPLLLHGSGPNLSRGFRKAISCHYADNNCYFINVQGTNQENVRNEVVLIAKKKYRSNLSFIDIWKAKSRLVRGSPGTFQKFENKL